MRLMRFFINHSRNVEKGTLGRVQRGTSLIHVVNKVTQERMKEVLGSGELRLYLDEGFLGFGDQIFPFLFFG